MAPESQMGGSEAISIMRGVPHHDRDRIRRGSCRHQRCGSGCSVPLLPLHRLPPIRPADECPNEDHDHHRRPRVQRAEEQKNEEQ